jgi:peroxiredoxin Q/BCP
MKFKLSLGVLIAAFLVTVLYVNAKTTGRPTLAKPTVSFSGLVGQPAPDFSLTSYDGRTVSLTSLRGKTAILFFNEGLMCYPACWNQIAALGSDQALNNAKVTTASIVTDTPDEWAAAIKKMPAMGQETLLFDTAKTVSANYDTLNLPSSMHKGAKPGHTYAIVGPDGIVRYTFDDTNMGVRNDKLIDEIKQPQENP